MSAWIESRLARWHRYHPSRGANPFQHRVLEGSLFSELGASYNGVDIRGGFGHLAPCIDRSFWPSCSVCGDESARQNSYPVELFLVADFWKRDYIDGADDCPLMF